MKIRTSIAGTVAAALIGAGAFAFPALASASTATHTLKFISLQKATVTFSPVMAGQQDTDVNNAGKVVGYDMLYYAVASKTTFDAWWTVDIDGGFLTGTFTSNATTGAITNGKVTGGSRAFKGATGTLTAKALNQAGTRVAVTITYRT